jgi:DNA ligase-1
LGPKCEAKQALHAPESFINALPRDVCLDGELFLDRNSFQETSSIVRSHSKKHWDRITFRLFDAPNENCPFEERLDTLKRLFPKAATFTLGSAHAPAGEGVVTLLEHLKCHSREDLLAKLQKVERVGGEGLMLRQPNSLYVGARSGTLLKLKSFYDAEARVIGYEDGKASDCRG